jgi:hypothetical protein
MGLFDFLKKKKETDDNNVEIKSFRDDSKKVYRDEEGLKKEFEGNVREKLYSNEDLDKHMFPTPLERFRGYNFQEIHDETSKWDYFEGFYNEWRRTICKDENIISEYDMWDYYRNYYCVDIEYLKEEPYDNRGNDKYEIMKMMRNNFLKKWKISFYDKGNKSWIDFDIRKIYRQIRVLMRGLSNPLPHFVWLMDYRSFGYCYGLTFNYTKWKGTKRTSQILFKSICDWENGKIFDDDEPQKEGNDLPLWIKWNEVGKDFLSMKTKLKKEGKGGLEWLKDEVGGYIKERKNYYNSFGDESEYFISDELIGKFESIK